MTEEYFKQLKQALAKCDYLRQRICISKQKYERRRGIYEAHKTKDNKDKLVKAFDELYDWKEKFWKFQIPLKNK